MYLIGNKNKLYTKIKFMICRSKYDFNFGFTGIELYGWLCGTCNYNNASNIHKDTLSEESFDDYNFLSYNGLMEIFFLVLNKICFQLFFLCFTQSISTENNCNKRLSNTKLSHRINIISKNAL